MTAPLCTCDQCQGAPKRWHKDARLPAGGWWRCAYKLAKYANDHYWNLSGFEYNRRQLGARRRKALARIAARKERYGDGSSLDAEQKDRIANAFQDLEAHMWNRLDELESSVNT